MAALLEAGHRLDVLAAPGGKMPPSPAYTTYAKTESFETPDSIAFHLLRIVDLTLAKSLPWGLKTGIYRNGNWSLSRLAKDEDIPARTNRAIEFIRSFGPKIVASRPEPAYKLLHLILPHGPWTTGDDCTETGAETNSHAMYVQTRCTTLALVELLDQLRGIDLYDRTAVLVHGDHGMAQGIGLPRSAGGANLPKYVGNANPLVLVKPLGSQGTLSISMREVQLLDIPATVADILEIETKQPGRSMFNDSAGEAVDCVFYEFHPNRVHAAKMDRVERVIKFTISGPISSLNSWTARAEDESLRSEAQVPGTLLDVKKSGVNRNNVMWITWNGPPPVHGLFAEVDGEAVPISVNLDRGFLSFSVGERQDSHEVYLVGLEDPQVRQKLRMPDY